MGTCWRQMKLDLHAVNLASRATRQYPAIRLHNVHTAKLVFMVFRYHNHLLADAVGSVLFNRRLVNAGSMIVRRFVVFIGLIRRQTNTRVAASRLSYQSDSVYPAGSLQSIST